MFNVCPNCGEYRVDKIVLSEGSYAVCPVCEYRHKFLRLPLFILTGASGVGKSTTCLSLSAGPADFVVMESDILWRDEFKDPATDYQNYRELWLRVCKNISQAGKPVLLCGTSLPEQFEACVERRYFSKLHYLALVCDNEVLAARLRSRPAWRRSGDEDYINRHATFNNWLKDNAATTQPSMTLLDTTAIKPIDTAELVKRWIRNCSTD